MIIKIILPTFLTIWVVQRTNRSLRLPMLVVKNKGVKLTPAMLVAMRSTDRALKSESSESVTRGPENNGNSGQCKYVFHKNMLHFFDRR